MPRRVARPSTLVGMLGGLGVALATTVPSQAAVSGRELSLDFEQGAVTANRGGTALSVRLLTHNGGTASTTSSHNRGTALRLPAFKAGSPPLAVLVVNDTTGGDDLSPGTAKFRFGASFALDQKSTGSSADNGDNLVQRGLFGARAQYKIQIDNKRPSCRVKGSAGAVHVTADRSVTPGEWYRALCSRDGSTVTLQVRRLSDGAKWTYRASGATGSVAPPSSTPLSVGGKVTEGGRLMTGASDQFNGRVDDVFVNVF